MQRFPELARIYGLNSENDIPGTIPEDSVAPYSMFPAKNGSLTAKENGKQLHSLYNPEKEAEQAVSSARSGIPDAYTNVFFSFGLGYAPLYAAKQFPDDALVIVEDDARYFFTALSAVDWTPVFSVRNCIIALGAEPQTVVSLIEQCGGYNHCAFVENHAQTEHAKDYFSTLRTILHRNRQKQQINTATLEKFSKLWLRNSCRNLHFLAELDGIGGYKNRCPKSLPFVILAAGPTLAETLPFLSELKKRAVLVAVDTSLGACLRAGVEPDFIILSDPQYYAYRHIAGLSAPTSILITESAAYPATFRFNCKKIMLYSSLFPLGKYVESKIGEKGTLAAGGSVSTSAWDFARYAGAADIYVSGLDLGYPRLQTHIKGATFEEKIHTLSTRLVPAEKQGVDALLGAGAVSAEDYSGGTILTDGKMKMFAWWFESKAEEFKDSVNTYSLSEQSLKIPGIKTARLSAILSTPEKNNERRQFLFEADKLYSTTAESSAQRTEAFRAALKELSDGLNDLYETAKNGLAIAEKAIAAPINETSKSGFFSRELEKIDAAILHSEFKDIASLVFPTEDILSRQFERIPDNSEAQKRTFQKSRIIYTALIESIDSYKNQLRPYF